LEEGAHHKTLVLIKHLHIERLLELLRQRENTTSLLSGHSALIGTFDGELSLLLLLARLETELLHALL
jgi:hypothetical protein